MGTEILKRLTDWKSTLIGLGGAVCIGVGDYIVSGSQITWKGIVGAGLSAVAGMLWKTKQS